MTAVNFLAGGTSNFMLTVRNQIIALVFELAKKPNAFDELEERVNQFSNDQLKEALLECGVIPEMFDQNSSEEKLWAKYCDILLSLAFSEIGLSAHVLRARGNSADVFVDGKTYTLVSDGKAFRLSRTAKNQKDFKISALNDWRKKDTYACLVAPLPQYPNTSSQIYSQAVSHNVTLLSYTHLLFLVEHATGKVLEDLWKIASSLQSDGEAQTYWNKLDQVVADLCGQPKQELERTKQLEIAKMKELGQEGISYWREKINGYQSLTQEQAIKQLIKSEKIESKIKTIERAIA